MLPEYLSGRDISHRSRPLRVPILHSGAIPLSSSWLTEAPTSRHLISDISPPIHISVPYLAKSGHFSIYRIAAILFLDLVEFTGVQTDLTDN